MGLQDFVIEFDKVERSYFAGQSVSGKIVLEIRQEKRIEVLELTFSGSGNVQWKAFSAGESKNNNNNSSIKRRNTNNSKTDKLQYPRTVSAEEIYLNGKIVLIKKVEERTIIILQPGKHEYPFEFRIPSDAPSTFLGPYGHVKYYLTAILKRPNFKRPHELKVPFTVNGVLDLNTFNLARTKTNGESNFVKSSSESNQTNKSSQSHSHLQIQRGESNYSIGEVRKFAGSSITPCLCLNKSIGFSLKLPRVSFVPGEYIQFIAEMTNMGKLDVSGVTLSLIQETKYYAEGETKTGQKIIVSSAKGPAVTAGESEIWETDESDCLFLEVPSLPPTNLGTCKIIGVEYFLQLEMEIYGRQNIKGHLPILIGSIPLKTTFKDFTAVKSASKLESKEFGKPTKPIAEILGYTGLVSPSFQEAKTYSLSSTVGGTPATGNFIKPPGKHLNHFCTDIIRTTESGEKDVDSDDEFIKDQISKEDLDLNFIPFYAKYISAYGED